MNELGSPPQVRGKLAKILKQNGVDRITPAGAGKTNFHGFNNNIPQDHPRRCGENGIRQPRLGRGGGSPPQVRGKRRRGLSFSWLHGITPAGAGKTAFKAAVFCNRQDHPRRCGENRGAGISCLWLTGSPPQVRGKLSINEF